MRTRIDSVEIKELLVIKEVVGEGTPDNPLKIVIHYYDLKGKKLFTI